MSLHPRRHYTTAPPEHVAVVGGGMTGLTTAYYLARWLPSSSRVTLYDSADRLGGWVHTVRRESPDGGVVHFENGPRMLRGLGKAGFRADDYVFYDLVWAGRPSAPLGPPLWHAESSMPTQVLTLGIDIRPQAAPPDIPSPQEALLLQ